MIKNEKIMDTTQTMQMMENEGADLSLEGSTTKHVSPQVLKVSSRTKEFQANFISRMSD